MAAMDIGCYEAPEDTDGSAPEEELSWRSDPDKSHSDWTVIVCLESSNLPGTSYPVHKCKLAFGPRRSNYFAAIFKTSLAEGAKRESELKLQESAADAFPTVLDWLYFGKYGTLSPISATALMHLAEYLRIKSLFEKVASYVKSDLNPSTAPVYVREANKYGLNKLMVAAITVCATHLGDFDQVSSDELCMLPLALFQRIVRLARCGSEAKSTRIAAYTKVESSNISSTAFDSLCAGLNSIDPGVATSLLRAALDRGIRPADADSKKKTLSDYCIRDAATQWESSVKFDDVNHDDMEARDKVRLLEALLSSARQDMQNLLGRLRGKTSCIQIRYHCEDRYGRTAGEWKYLTKRFGVSVSRRKYEGELKPDPSKSPPSALRSPLPADYHDWNIAVVERPT